MRHTITILVENEFGVLTRVAGLFSARGYNIETLNVAPLKDRTVSRMTLVTIGDEHVIEQIKKQLNKLVPVIKVEDISHTVHFERGMLMVKVKADGDSYDGLLEVAEKHDARVIDDHIDSHMILEFTGKVELLDSVLEELEPFGIIEMTRTGPLGMRRGVEGFNVD
ncbi:acetolactate synthase, small subunit [Mariprofundus ferrinatatus]|uniref:Acetolactate synthase small subunit n=1 Tax=Mariprofundus ferrinatatus TaxID=1921087 RepID=A0A2K8LA00_9PROT|nr:acetolactate synthase small subunit [Mariprofundus ferrinatatus]ATX83079.1 acetolactate synthase, small subunit [Mariprofundus ferrinatatus]